MMGRRRSTGRIAAIAIGLTLALAGSSPAAPGDLYVSDEDGGPSSGAVFKLAPSGGDTAELFANHLPWDSPGGMAMLPSGDLLVADEDTESLFEVDRASGAVSEFVTISPSSFRDVAIRPDGKILVSNTATDQLLTIDPSTKQVSPLATLSAQSDGNSIAAARDGSVYVSDIGATPRILKIRPGGSITTLSDSPLLLSPDTITLSADQRTLFVAAFDPGATLPGHIVRVDTASGAASSLGDFDFPRAVSLLPDRSLLVGQPASYSAIRRIPFLGAPAVFSEDPDLLFPRDILVEPPRCAGRLATAVGTTGADSLRGSASADVFATLGGGDVVRGLGGPDVICGGGGGDRLLGGGGRDLLLGQAGRDRLIGGPGRDRLRGGPGRDKQKQ